MEFRQTKNQVARGARPDGVTFDKFVLIKRTLQLHATYQIRLLLYRAVQEGKKLVIEVPQGCKIHSDLWELAKQHSRNVMIARA